jgi:hypothetical protein
MMHLDNPTQHATRSNHYQVGQELARMLDALAASDARDRLARQLPGGPAAAEALVPTQPAEEEARDRAMVLMRALGGRLQSPGAVFKVGQGLQRLGSGGRRDRVGVRGVELCAGAGSASWGWAAACPHLSHKTLGRFNVLHVEESLNRTT